MIFGYDASRQSLVYPHPATGLPTFITVAELIAIGYKVSEIELRKLPRFDRPAVELATGPLPRRIRR